MNDELIGVEGLMAEDGYINFYSLLRVERTAAPEEIIENINALYQEAQTNRDHRVSARRREYGILMEILPQARTVLTDKARRKRYDAYCNAVDMQLPRMPYPDFFDDLIREREALDARSDILTVRDLSRLRSFTSETSNSEGAASKSTVTPKQELVKEVATDPEVITTPTPTSLSPQGVASLPVVSAPISTSVQTEIGFTQSPIPAPASSYYFPKSALIGGVIVFLGMLASLPTYAAVPLVLATPLSLISAAVTTYVFALAAEPSEA
jgi:hypothetical protein